MRMRIVRVILRVSALLGLAGILATNAMAGGGTTPDPDGPGRAAVQQGVR